MTGPWTVAVVGLWLAVVTLAIVVVGVLRRIGGVLEAAESALLREAPAVSAPLPVGSVVPPFTVRDESDHLIPSTELLAAPQIVVFAEDACPPCESVLRELASVDMRSVALTVIADETHHRPVIAFDASRVFFQRDHVASIAFTNRVAPHAYAVKDGVLLGSQVVGSARDVIDLANATIGGDALSSNEPLRSVLHSS